jgi:hypothetical protein
LSTLSTVSPTSLRELRVPVILSDDGFDWDPLDSLLSNELRFPNLQRVEIRAHRILPPDYVVGMPRLKARGIYYFVGDDRECHVVCFNIQAHFITVGQLPVTSS